MLESNVDFLDHDFVVLHDEMFPMLEVDIAMHIQGGNVWRLY